MKHKQYLHALYQGAVLVRVLGMTVKYNQKIASVLFDNGEVAEVPCSDLQMKFDLIEA